MIEAAEQIVGARKFHHIPIGLRTKIICINEKTYLFITYYKSKSI